MRAKRIDQSDIAIRIAKSYEIFTENKNAQRRAVGRRKSVAG